MSAPPAKEEITRKLADLFRAKGFDGVSVADISAATGLGRSSLYHYFPGGKEDMARAVNDLAAHWLQAHMFAPIAAGDRAARVEAFIAACETLFDGGAAPCIITSMMVGDEQDAFGFCTLLKRWVAELAKALAETGLSPEEAQLRANLALAQVEGGLLIARGVRDRGVFGQSLEAARRLLLA